MTYMPCTTRAHTPLKSLYSLSRSCSEKGLLDVGGGHSIYYRVAKAQTEHPKNVVYVHGGPGSSSASSHRRYFNPKVYRVIQFDQRGCGQSIPLGHLENNSLSNLVEDMEKLRLHLKLEKWVVYAGSWGAAIALRYAAKYPEHVEALVVWSAFLGSARERDWAFSRHGAAVHYPDDYSTLMQSISSDCLASEYRLLLQHADHEVLLETAKSWVTWETATMNMDASFFDEPGKLVHRFRMAMHFLLTDTDTMEGRVWTELSRIPDSLPVFILHGEHDLAVPPDTAQQLKQEIPHATVRMLSASGHCLGPAWGNQPEWDHILVDLADSLI